MGNKHPRPMPILILLKNLGRLPQSSLHAKSTQDGQSLVFLSQAIQRSVSLSGAMHIKQKENQPSDSRDTKTAENQSRSIATVVFRSHKQGYIYPGKCKSRRPSFDQVSKHFHFQGGRRCHNRVNRPQIFSNGIPSPSQEVERSTLAT